MINKPLHEAFAEHERAKKALEEARKAFLDAQHDYSRARNDYLDSLEAHRAAQPPYTADNGSSAFGE